MNHKEFKSTVVADLQMLLLKVFESSGVTDLQMLFSQFAVVDKDDVFGAFYQLHSSGKFQTNVNMIDGKLVVLGEGFQQEFVPDFLIEIVRRLTKLTEVTKRTKAPQKLGNYIKNDNRHLKFETWYKFMLKLREANCRVSYKRLTTEMNKKKKERFWQTEDIKLKNYILGTKDKKKHKEYADILLGAEAYKKRNYRDEGAVFAAEVPAFITFLKQYL